MQRAVLVLVVVAAVFVAAPEVHSAVSQAINYQAVLKQNGVPVTTATNVTFRIYDVASGGTAVWTEPLSVTPDSDGRLSVRLGETTAINETVFTGADRWLGVQIQGDASEMSPRMKLASAPYSFRVATVDGSKAGTLEGDLRVTAAAAAKDGMAVEARVVLISSTGDSVVIGPADQIVFKAFDGTTEIMSAKNDPTVGALFSLRDPGGNIVDHTGASSSYFRNSTKGAAALAKKMEVSADGLVVFGTTEDDTLVFVDNAGAMRGAALNIQTQGFTALATKSPQACAGGANLGISTELGNGAYGEGNDLSAATNSFAVGGCNTILTSSSSTAFGTENIISHPDGVAIGKRNTIQAPSSFAAGADNRITGGGENICMGDSNSVHGGNSSIFGGQYDTIYGGANTTTGGGRRNVASRAGWGFIGGGDLNRIGDGTADFNNCVLTGGGGNFVKGQAAFLGGGSLNEATGNQAVCVGGNNNSASNGASFVGGGDGCVASGVAATVTGGDANVASGDRSFVGGGRQNNATGEASAVGGGRGNAASGSMSAIAGGLENNISATGDSSFIGGGYANVVSGGLAFVGGGYANNVGAGATNSFIGGGLNHSVASQASFVGGGSNNDIVGLTSPGGTIAGGTNNSITASGGQQAQSSTIGGGNLNSITDADQATIPGGAQNSANGDYSFAAGRRAKVNHDGAFVWGDHTNADVSSERADQFRVRADGGSRFDDGTQYVDIRDDGTNLITTSTGTCLSLAGVWGVCSDRNVKENFNEIDRDALLEKIADLKITEWNYKAEGKNIRHIGPMAQDFYATFGVGTDDVTIPVLDPAGIALAAIQALTCKTEELDQKTAEIDTLREQVAELKRLVESMSHQR